MVSVSDMGYCTMIVFTYKTLIMLQYAYEYVSETDLVNEIATLWTLIK